MTKAEARAMRRILMQRYYTDAEAVEVPHLLNPWKAGQEYKAGDRVQYGGTAYKVVQAHTAQADWTPDKTPALFTVLSVEEWPEWVQPTGTQDAYNQGDKVTFEGNRYISLIDGNVWSPVAYPAGWEKQEV